VTHARGWSCVLSVTTLSSTGLSDAVPVLPFARGLVMLEQVAGVGYIATVVSRLITLLAARKAEHGAGRDDDGVA
jgi:hypothetical protein